MAGMEIGTASCSSAMNHAVRKTMIEGRRGFRHAEDSSLPTLSMRPSILNFGSMSPGRLNLRGGSSKKHEELRDLLVRILPPFLSAPSKPLIATIMRLHSFAAVIGGATMYLMAIFGQRQLGMLEYDSSHPACVHLARLSGLFYCALGAMEFVASGEVKEENEVTFGKVFVGYHVLTYVHDIMQLHTGPAYNLVTVIPASFLLLGLVALNCC
ncbi:hypothetical protein GUITHDRAFT_148227 [Guillardia theta CCMP2712]|uniref:Uncharacterized protein n=1 Tax=Guillardia theta (strain CCMP2712) TaxID=905079 RepID=L1I9Q1_GUITC|nr:hypothetical protein GUITHDRAFT_148227 [Guillardia theta CCMP2712]EKX32981.1 hypothetical protein GUITHDRAFT_148227 [Guillardia theta CCMP2712]|eukprot:XP_005819961.1 hypothetical protein GUITHDRAFT_148227 [Guillardia theta CCMP2712]